MSSHSSSYPGCDSWGFLKPPELTLPLKACLNSINEALIFSMDLNRDYPVKYSDTTEVFLKIIQIATNSKQYVKDFKILIYNGDVGDSFI